MADTERQVYLNGRFLPRSQAHLDIEERGAMFADGVYEVLRYYGGRPFAMGPHVQRFRRSIAAIQLPQPAELGRIGEISDELVRRNAMPQAVVYWQVSRGAAPRNATFPQGVTPTVLMLAYPVEPIDPAEPAPGATAIMADDVRWHHCAIKSLMLLPNVLAHNRALAAGADMAIFHRDGVVTEGTSTNVAIVRRGELWTHPADQWILGGISRGVLLDLARQDGITVHEQTFTTDELFAADELLACGTTRHVAGVVNVDGRTIGDGQVGPVTRRLHAIMLAHIAEVCGLT